MAVPLDTPLGGIAALIAGGLIFCTGLFVALGLVLLVALLEGLVLRAFGWGAFFRTWRIAFWANLVSTLAGIPLYMLLGEAMFAWWSIAACALLSVAIESGVLWLFRRDVAPKKLLAACGAANAASYALIVLFLLVRQAVLR